MNQDVTGIKCIMLSVFMNGPEPNKTDLIIHEMHSHTP